MTIALSKGSAVQYGNLVVTPSGRDWIYVSNKLIANADYDTIKIYLKCNYNANYTYFDDVTIFKDVFGESFSYDSKGNVISVVDMAKNTASITTNAAKTDITSYKDGAGNTYSFSYNTSAPKKHELTQCVSPDGTASKMAYDNFGNLTFMSIYANGDTARNSSSKAIRTETRYDSDGIHIAATVDPRENVVNYTYESPSSDLLKSVSDPGDVNSKTEYVYDSGTDKLTKVKHNGMDNTVTYGYSNEQLTKVMVGTLQYNFAYNALGNILSVGTGSSSSNIESYHYNGRNQLDQITYGNGQTVNYTYDNQERLASASDANGKILDYDYNSNGLLGSATYYSEGTPVTTDYQYDFAERYTSCYNSKGFGIDTITYDKNNNNTGYRAYLKHSGVNLSFDAKYAYNNVNALTKMTVATETDESTIDLTYDDFSRLSETTTALGNTKALHTKSQYIDVSSTRTTNLLDTYKVYLCGNESTADYSYKYTYDASGNITSVANTLKNGTTQTVNYGYDKLNQLTSVENYGNLGIRDEYTYDDRGNIVSKISRDIATNSNAGQAFYSYDTSHMDRLNTYTAYNGNGYITKDRLYQYDEVGNLCRITDGAGYFIGFGWSQGKKLTRYTCGETDNTYYYNESGLVSKVVKANGSSVEYFYDDDQLEYEEYRSASGSILRVHKYFYDDDGVVRFIMTSAGIFGNNVNVNLYAYVYDGAGNITDLVQLKMQRPQFPLVSASLAAHYEYDAYGRIVSETNYARTENIAKLNPIRYKGYYYETDTEMYRLDSRYYDPLIGRFINADDPSLLTESPNDLTDKNLYNYCDNNPVNRKDSDGEFWHIAVGAAIGAATSALIEIGRQLYCDGKVTDWGSVAQNAISGAVTGGLAASGAGLAVQVLANAGSGAISTALSVDKNKSWKDKCIEVAAGGAVGAIAGRLGGPGVGKQVGRIASSPIKRSMKMLKNKKGLKTAAKEFRKGWRYVKKHSKYLYTRGLRKDCYWRGYRNSTIVNGIYNGYKAYRGR